jgi:uncharacterized protein YjaZ
MKYRKTIALATLLFTLANAACNDQTQQNITRVERFDLEMLRLVNNDAVEDYDMFLQNYTTLVTLISKSVFRNVEEDPKQQLTQLVNYYKEPNLLTLYQDAVKQYQNVKQIEYNLGKAFAKLKQQLPNVNMPKCYLHVSGLQQNVIAADSLLSLSIDKYLGHDYPLYQHFFYEQQRRKMEPDFVVPDFLTAWLLSEFPFKGNPAKLIEKMIYEGKIKYALYYAYPQLIPELWMGYSPGQYQWCKQNEKMVWHFILENNHLYNTDYVTTAKYFNEKNSNFITTDAPPNLGTWIGWQIVAKYMNKNKGTIKELLHNNDYVGILKIAKYKPN